MFFLHTAWIRLQAAAFTATRPPQRRRDRADDGQGMVEYALILVLVAIVVIVTVGVVGKKVTNIFSNISSGLGT